MTEARHADLVLEGGGVKSVAILGAVLELADAGYSFPRIAGTSGGAIVGSLVAAYQRRNRDLHELVPIINALDYGQLIERSGLSRLVWPTTDLVELVLREGAHSGERVINWLSGELARVGVSNFKDLAFDDPGGSLEMHQRYTLVVHVTDLSRRALVRLPWDYRHYSKDPDQQSVAAAVWASSAIPLVFRPVEVTTNRGKVTWVDGGVLAGFPITVFDRTDGKQPRWPTWGIRLSAEPQMGRDRPIRTVVGVELARLRTLSQDWTHYSLQDEGVSRRTIHVDTTTINVRGFNIDSAARRALLASGRTAARRFLASKMPSG